MVESTMMTFRLPDKDLYWLKIIEQLLDERGTHITGGESEIYRMGLRLLANMLVEADISDRVSEVKRWAEQAAERWAEAAANPEAYTHEEMGEYKRRADALRKSALEMNATREKRAFFKQARITFRHFIQPDIPDAARHFTRLLEPEFFK